MPRAPNALQLVKIRPWQAWELRLWQMLVAWSGPRVVVPPLTVTPPPPPPPGALAETVTPLMVCGPGGEAASDEAHLVYCDWQLE